MADQFILDLIGKLNKTETETNIRNQLRGIVKDLKGENIPQFIGKLDYKTTETNIRKQLASISKGLNFNINPSIGKSPNVVDSALKVSKSTSIASNLFNSADLDKQGRNYFYKVTNIIDRVKSYYLKQGALKVDVANIQNANGKIQGFTATVEQSTGEIKKFNYEYGKINNSKNTGYIQTNTVSSVDKNAGTNLKSTINLLNQVERQIANVNSKTLNVKNPLQMGTTQFDTYKKAYDEIIAKVENLKNANKSMTSAQKAELQTLANAFKNLAREQQVSATGATKLDASSVTASVEKSTASLQTLEEKWKQQGILVGDFKSKVEALKIQLATISDAKSLSNYSTQFSVISSEAQKLYLIQTNKQKEVNALLQKQTNSLNNINKLRTQIAIGQGKTNNQTTVTELNRQLNTEQQIYKTIQQEMSQYSSLINNEQRRASLKNITATAENKIRLAQANQSDKNNANNLNLSNLHNINTAKLTSDLNNLNQKVQIAQNRFKMFQNTLKPSAIKNQAGAINEISTAYNKVSQAINNKDLGGAKKAFTEAQLSATKFRTSMQEMGSVGEGVFSKLGKNVKQFASYLMSATLIMLPIRMIREAVTTMKEVDTLLTEISKTSNITASNLKKLGLEAFDSANKYGATVQGYLTGIQEMSRAGFEENQAKQLASLSILAQSAGDMTADLANQYLIATNFAYGYGGSVEKLNAVLDSQNQINKMVCLYGNI